MRIDEIHIGGFGIMADRHAEGLSSGMNVLYGPNEFGKSTLLHFVRRMLFGFPRKSPTVNPYPPLQGGAYGGRIACTLDSGERITIGRGRKEGPRGGHVTVTTSRGEVTGQGEVQSLLGYITGTFYENVYALGLDELQEVKSLEGEEVRNRIYGAGLGLGDVSLTDVKAELRKLSESLYKPTGRGVYRMAGLSTKIRDLGRDVREIQRELAQYDTLLRKRDSLTSKVVVAEKQLRRLEREERFLENKVHLFPVYLEYAAAESELSLLEEVLDLHETALEDLETLQTELQSLERAIDEKGEERGVLAHKKDALVVNEGMIASEASVISLQKLSEKYTTAVKDIGQIQMERKQRAEEIDRSVSRLGSQWDRDAVRGFTPTHAQEDSIQAFRSRFEEVKGRIDDARARLEYHREQKAASASRGFSALPLPKYALVATTLIGLLGTTYGLVISEWVLAGLLAVIPLVGVWAMVRTIKAPPVNIMDPTEKVLSERLALERAAREGLQAEWEKLLHSIDLESGLSVSAASEAVRAILEIQVSLNSLDDLDSRIRRMQDTIDKVVQLHREVIQDVGGAPTTDDVAANIELLSSHLEDAKKKKLHREGLQTQIDILADKVATLSKERDQSAQRVRDYIASYGCSDEDDFRSKWATHTKRSALLGKMDDCRHQLQTVIGTGEHFDDFIGSISSASPDQIQSELDQVRGHRSKLGEERDTMNTTLGELRAEIVRLSSGEDLLVKQSDVEVERQQLRECAVDWVRSQLALAVLDSAIAKHESTRQPQVIKAAEDFFSYMTGGRYPSIVKRLDDDELVVRDAQDRSRELTELSRGTREEMYLAMRLGLIEEYEKRSESMPVIMDDILANFDDDRGPLAVQLIAKFAENRQVIVLTCHKDTYDRYCQSGAKPVELV